MFYSYLPAKTITTLPVIEKFASASTDINIFNTIVSDFKDISFDTSVLGDLSDVEKHQFIKPLASINPIVMYYIDYTTTTERDIVISGNSIQYTMPVKSSDRFGNNLKFEDYLQSKYTVDTFRKGSVIRYINDNNTYVYYYDTKSTSYLVFLNSSFTNLIIKTDAGTNLSVFFFNTNVDNFSVVPTIDVNEVVPDGYSSTEVSSNITIRSINPKSINYTNIKHTTPLCIYSFTDATTTPVSDTIAIGNNSVKVIKKLASNVEFNGMTIEDYLVDKYASDLRSGVVRDSIIDDNTFIFNYDINTTKYILFNECTFNNLIIQVSSIQDIQVFFYNTNVKNWSFMFKPTLEYRLNIELDKQLIKRNNLNLVSDTSPPKISISGINQIGIINQLYLRIPLNKIKVFTIDNIGMSSNKDDLDKQVKIKDELIEDYVMRLYKNNTDNRYNSLIINEVNTTDNKTYDFTRDKFNFDTMFILNSSFNKLIIRTNINRITNGFGLFTYKSNINNVTIILDDFTNVVEATSPNNTSPNNTNVITDQSIKDYIMNNSNKLVNDIKNAIIQDATRSSTLEQAIKNDIINNNNQIADDIKNAIIQDATRSSTLEQAIKDDIINNNNQIADDIKNAIMQDITRSSIFDQSIKDDIINNNNQTADDIKSAIIQDATRSSILEQSIKDDIINNNNQTTDDIKNTITIELARSVAFEKTITHDITDINNKIDDVKQSMIDNKLKTENSIKLVNNNISTNNLLSTEIKQDLFHVDSKIKLLNIYTIINMIVLVSIISLLLYLLNKKK